MTFYWKPPRGCMELDEIIECVHQRMHLISAVIDDRPLQNINLSYFVEGTAVDRASHFLLRLVTSASPVLKNFIVKGETELCRKRLSFFNSKQLIELIAVSIRHIDEILDCRLNIKEVDRSFLRCSRSIFAKLLKKRQVIEHIFSSNHPEFCSKFHTIVPFKYCLPLVASREVELKNGYAWVYCSSWTKLITSIFQLHLLYGYEDLLQSGIKLDMQDSRIHHLSNIIESKYMERPISSIVSSSQEIGDFLTCDNIEERSQFFPPCARNLIDTLKIHHRLGHHARVQLTLFLKEAGMPVKDAIAFWRRHYSMPATCCGSNCTHSWQKDERRYVYSIRHLYGLEGSRTNYSAPMCSTLQENILAPGVSGGCPFSRMTEGELEKLLDKYLLKSESKRFIFAESRRPSKSCDALLKSLIDSKETVVTRKPSQFYLRCKNWEDVF
ncbi:uncharacterized protein LOC132196042 [Neocloeon triangulifer]|uniref:uncharacterized protein LOC132196042 n=1 Tax=Neocloeon triangulifer TaxID=2078957 RepID=UPI00286FAC1C|nr:uncharacterized protein LOC132196042 [Neocloeon triangulifer]